MKLRREKESALEKLLLLIVLFLLFSFSFIYLYNFDAASLNEVCIHEYIAMLYVFECVYFTTYIPLHHGEVLPSIRLHLYFVTEKKNKNGETRIYLENEIKAFSEYSMFCVPVRKA